MSFENPDPRATDDEDIPPESDYDEDECDDDLTVKPKSEKPKMVTMRDFEMYQMFGNP